MPTKTVKEPKRKKVVDAETVENKAAPDAKPESKPIEQAAGQCVGRYGLSARAHPWR